MGFHDNLLSRKQRPKIGPAAAPVQRQAARNKQRAEASDYTPALSRGQADPVAPTWEGARGRGDDATENVQTYVAPHEPPFSVDALADRWGCSRGVVYSLIRAGKLAHFRIGDLIRVPAAEVGKFECGL